LRGSKARKQRREARGASIALTEWLGQEVNLNRRNLNAMARARTLSPQSAPWKGEPDGGMVVGVALEEPAA
jgi:hypothetical protein